jgi:hypothetical protein
MTTIKKIYFYVLILIGSILLSLNSCEKGDIDDNGGNNEKGDVPVLSTTEITDITNTTATSGGNITDDGGAFIIARGVCWSTVENPTIQNNSTSDGTGAGSFTSIITGLESNTKYFVRAYAVNSKGISYGNIIEFETLKALENNYSEVNFVYIVRDDLGVMYGKTISNYSPSRIITANNMALIPPGTFKIMSYSWDEQNGTKQLYIDGQLILADIVQVTSDVVDVDQTTLMMSQLPEIEDPKEFLEFAPPIYADSREFMGDNWIFQYSLEVPKGQSAFVEFYKRDDEADSDVIKIDVNISYTGTPDGTAIEKKTDFLALNMSQLRVIYEGTSPTETKRLNIKFVYHLKDRDEAVESQTYTLTVKK